MTYMRIPKTVNRIIMEESKQLEEEIVFDSTSCLGPSFLDPKKFVNSPEFASLSIDERTNVVKDYLYHSAKPVYQCLLHTPNEKCFLYNSKDGIYADKKYLLSVN